MKNCFFGAVAVVGALVPFAVRRLTHDIAVNAKSSASEGAPEGAENKALLERTEKAEAEIANLKDSLDLANSTIKAREAEIDRLQELLSGMEQIGPAIDGTREEIVTPETWAERQLEIYKRAVFLGNLPAELDPEVREKLRAGLSIEQAIDVLSAQRSHDAAQAENQTAKSA